MRLPTAHSFVPSKPVGYKPAPMNRTALWWIPGLLVASACATTLDRARLAYESGDLDQAQSLYRQALDDPEEGQLARDELVELLVDGAGSVEKDDAATAQVTYRAALELSPVHDGALTGLVRLLRRQGKAAEAAAVLALARQAGNCGTCKRLEAIVLVEQATADLADGKWEAALQRYAAAQTLRPAASTALGIVRAHLGAGRHDAAADALVEAARLVRANEPEAVRAFTELRRQLVAAAMSAGNTEQADRLRGIAPEGLTSSDQVGLSLSVADRLRDTGKHKEAISRYHELLKAADQGKLELSPAERTEIHGRLAVLHARKAVTHLHAGRGPEADAELAKALKMQPDDWTMKLQRILALAEATGAKRALESLGHVPAKTPGLKPVTAIVGGLHAMQLAERGKFKEAQAAAEVAQAASDDLPEVHLALAVVAASSATEDLDAREIKALKKASIVAYPGPVFRYAEARGELVRARQNAHDRGTRYPYRGPWFERESERLARKLAAVYPYAVKFSSDPEGQINFKNTSGRRMRIEVAGPDGFETELTLAAGEEKLVVIPDPGLMKLRVNGKKKTFFAESYAVVTLTL